MEYIHLKSVNRILERESCTIFKCRKTKTGFEIDTQNGTPLVDCLVSLTPRISAGDLDLCFRIHLLG